MNRFSVDYRTIVAWLPVGLLMALMPTLLFPIFPAQRAVLIMSVLAWIVDVIVNRRWEGWRMSGEKWVFALMIVFFLLTPLHQLFDIPATTYYHQQIERRLPFLVVGLMGLVGFSDKLRVRYIGYAMLLSGAAALVTVLILQGVDGHLQLEEFRYWFNLTRHMNIASHMEYNLYLNIALVMGFHALQSRVPRAVKIAIVIAMFACFGMLLISDGRVGMLTALVMVLVLGLRLPAVRRYAWVTGVLVILIAGGALWHICRNPRFSWEYVRQETRLVVWDYSVEMIKEKPWVGYGLSSLSEEYVTKAYEHQGMREIYFGQLLQLPEFSERPRDMYLIHPHSTFLEITLEHGVIGLFVLLGLIIAAAAVRMRPQDKWYYAMTLAAIMLQACFEPLGKYFPPILICVTIFVWIYGVERRSEVESELPSQTSD